MSDLTNDLSASQLATLLQWLWANQYAVTRPNVKQWRRDNLQH